MPEIIALIVFGGSLIGMVVIVFRKIPVLVSLPEIPKSKEGIKAKFGKKIKELPIIKNFSLGLFLEKLLKRIRILVLKIENLTFIWLQKLKESHKRKSAPKLDEYWEKIRQEIKKIKK